MPLPVEPVTYEAGYPYAEEVWEYVPMEEVQTP